MTTRKARGDGAPSISVVVNTTDRARPLRALLRALEHQSYRDFEVVVVVGPTRDDTLDLLQEYAGRVRVLRCPAANLSRSRNIGLLAARGDVVAYIDDDAVPCRTWLEQLAGLFEDEGPDGGLDATGGIVQLAHPNEPRLQHRWGLLSSQAEQSDVRPSRVHDLAPDWTGARRIERMMGTNMAYRRATLLEAGGFDGFYEWVYDETDLNLRLANRGARVDPVGQAVVYHFPASSRNRVAFTYTGKWWIQTKASIYYTIKNGRASGDGARAIARRCAHLFHGHWLWAGDLAREGKITRRQFWDMRANEARAALNGAVHGLAARRATLGGAAAAPGPILPFLNAESARQPVADPVSGERGAAAQVTLPDPPLRITLLSSAYPPNQIEGVGRHTNLMARGLFECGHAVHVIARGETERVSFYDGAYVHRIPVRLERYDRYRPYTNLYWALNHSHGVYQKLQLLMLNDGIQIADTPLYQLDGLVACVSGLLPVVARLQTATRQVTTIQRTPDDDARLTGEMEESLVHRAAHLAPNSLATVKAAAEVYHLRADPERYTVIPHGIVPVGEHAVRPFDPAAGRDALTVLYVGRLEKRKGIEDLFAAIPAVLEKLPQARFVIAGTDNSTSDGFAKRTGLTYPAYFARRHPTLAARVTFAGNVSDAELETLYQTCDLFVAPSLYESFGLIYTEAMNYAKPVIGCRAGGIPEVVDDGVTGKLVDPESPGQLAEAMIQLLQSPHDLRDMGLAGRRRLLERFTYVQMARQFADVYRRVLAARAA